MSYQVVTPASGLILTTAEAKAQIVVEHSADDAYIDGLIAAAQRLIETKLSRQLLPATLRLHRDRFPCGSDRTIWLRRPPVQSVESVKYVASDGTLTTLDPSAYIVDEFFTPPRIVRANGASWPAARVGPQAVQVTFVAGYVNAAAVPATIKQAALLLIDHWYENRSAVAFGTIASDLPQGVEALLSAESWGGWCDE
ncbi:MAG: head-tail connector protein [Planctomycetota bacterium]